MRTWDLYPPVTAPMPFQMALDEVLYRRAIQSSGSNKTVPSLRFYFSSDAWITIGYSQKNVGLSPAVPHCRRITGGGKVFHGEDLVFSFIAAKDQDLAFHSVKASYLRIHEAVKSGLEKLGKKARFYRCTENLAKGDECFRFPIASDLAVGERKVAGGAQKRSCGVFLHQESIQLEESDPRALMSAILGGFRSVFDVEFADADFLPSWFFEAEDLARLKYEITKEPGAGDFGPLSETREALSAAGGLA